MNNHQTPPEPRQVMKAIWFAFLSSHFILMALTYLKDPLESAIEPNPTNNAIIAAYGVISIIASAFVVHFMLNARNKTTEPLNENHIFVPYIISLALNESGAIIAFVLGYVFYEQTLSFAIFALSIIAFAFKFPSNDKIDQLIKKHS